MGKMIEQRMEAVRLIELGHGHRTIAKRFGISNATAQEWLYTYRIFGEEGLFVSTHKKYSQEEKLAAVIDFLEHGLTKFEIMEKYQITSKSALERWIREYQSEGIDALTPKKKGRKTKAEKKANMTREEQLEARILELELELEIQKRINALVEELGLE